MYYNPLMNGLSVLPMTNHGRSRAINAENPRGEKGKGGMAASHLGTSRKRLSLSDPASGRNSHSCGN